MIYPTYICLHPPTPLSLALPTPCSLYRKCALGTGGPCRKCWGSRRGIRAVRHAGRRLWAVEGVSAILRQGMGIGVGRGDSQDYRETLV